MKSYRNMPEIIALALAYYFTGRVGALTAMPPGIATAIWPPSGVALAALLSRGNRLWPGIVLGSVALNFGILSHSERPSLFAIAAALCIACGSVMQALLGAGLVRRFIEDAKPLDCVRAVLQFIGIEIVSCLVSPTVGSTAIFASGFLTADQFGETWFTWWLGDSVGILVVTPLLLTLTDRNARVLFDRARVAQAGFLLLSMLVASQFVFGVPFRLPLPHFAMAYLFLPIVVWASFVCGIQGGVTAITITAVLAIWGTIRGTTQFVGQSFNESLLAVQFFVGITAVTGLALGAVLMERRRLDEDRLCTLEAERTLRLRLAQTNEDLEGFVRVASHDLQEPLRMITSYLGLLERKSAGALSADANDYIRFAVDGATRMRRLIDGLLDFYRPGRVPSKFKLVACSDILDEVVASLRLSIDEKRAQVTRGPLPVVWGDRATLGQLFQNLIANALKYQDGRETPTVHVSARKHDDEWRFCVKDNGIGLDMSYAKQIFDVFRRLHAVDEYPGSGLGLAHCKRVVERHDGKIWVESVPDRGSEFYFSIRARPNGETPT